MKVLIVILGLIMFGACTDTEEVEQEQVKTEQVEEVKEEVKEVVEVKEEVKVEEQKDFKQVLNEKYKPEFDELFKNSPYPMIAFEHKNDKNYVTLQADITRNEWIEGFISSADSRGSNCPMLASKRGGHSQKVIEEWVANCRQQVESGAYDNTKWIFHYLGIGNEQEEFDVVFEPLASLHCLTGDKKNLEITVVDVNGDLLYKVANEDKEVVFESLKSWTSDEQLWILSHVKEFAYDVLWFGYYKGWLGLE